MASIRDIFVRLGVKTDPRGLKRANAGLNNLKSNAISLGRIFATGALAIGFKKLIEAASDIQETANKFGAVFGEAGSDVQQQLDKIREKTGATNLRLQTMASSIGALVKPSLGSAAAAGKMAAGVAELALDIASFNDVSADDALTAIRSGLIGSAEPLQRFGVDTRVAALELEAMRQGISGGVKAMTEGQRVTLRYASIQRQLGVQGATGDATRTALDFANASRNLGDAMKETSGIIGTFFLKSTGGLVNRIREMVNGFQEWLAVNRKLIQQRFDKFIGGARQIIVNVATAIGRIVSAIREWAANLSPLGTGLLKIGAIAAALAILMALPGGSLLLLLALLALIIDDFETWGQGGESVIGDLIGSLVNLQEAFGPVGDAIAHIASEFVEAFNLIVRGFKFVGGLLGTLAGFFVEQITAVFSGDFKKVLSNVIAVIDRLAAVTGIDLSGIARQAAGLSGGTVAPRAAAAGSGPVSITGDTSIIVEVTAAPGMSVDDLGEAIPREMKKAMDAQNRQDAQSFITEGP